MFKYREITSFLTSHAWRIQLSRWLNLQSIFGMYFVYNYSYKLNKQYSVIDSSAINPAKTAKNNVILV